MKKFLKRIANREVFDVIRSKPSFKLKNDYKGVPPLSEMAYHLCRKWHLKTFVNGTYKIIIFYEMCEDFIQGKFN